KFLQLEDGLSLIKVYLQESGSDNVLGNDKEGVVIGVYTKPDKFDKLFEDSNYNKLQKIYLPWHKKELVQHLEKNKNSIAI
ncbi:MAG: hypothetical protein HRT43_03995, partial [Campylobacteraceae bacterium]|nr:hypothetical protein [Campylobacteraceae bacterium]